MYKFIAAGLITSQLALGVSAGNADNRPVASERLLIIGIDGMTFNVIDPLVEEGEIAHLRKTHAKRCTA